MAFFPAIEWYSLITWRKSRNLVDSSNLAPESVFTSTLGRRVGHLGVWLGVWFVVVRSLLFDRRLRNDGVLPEKQKRPLKV
jgi:hypothetical protein